MAANNNQNNRRSAVRAECIAVAQNALLDGSQNGFNFLSSTQPLVPDNSSSADSNEMAADLAARQTEHCLEAWNYMSQSVVALLNGKENIAIHLAYYAEVRAASSLLSSTGIALKNLPNYYMDTSNRRRAFRVGTHIALREIWQTWCARPDAIDAFETLKVAPSTKLTDVFSAMGLTSSNQNSLLNWAYELINFTDDHNSRNVASYNTSKVYDNIPSFDEPKHGNFIALIWDHLSSTGVTGQFRFEQLYSQYLIWCYCLDFATSGGNGMNASDAFKAKYDDIISVLSNSTGADQNMLKLVLPVVEDEDERFSLFALASSTDTAAENIISRAFILTRLATNKLNNNLIQTSCVEGVSWIKTWLLEAGVLSDGIDASDIAVASDYYCEKASELLDVPNRDIWNDQMAFTAMQSCRLDLGLCWGIDL